MGLACLALGTLAACPAPEPVPVDADRDGVPSDRDCDDADPFVYPGAQERCNGVDDDCDGTVDGPSATPSTLWFTDGDGDGFGHPDTAVRSCEAPDGLVARGEDCDDEDDTVHPGAPDTCDGVDSNCDGVVDDAPDTRAYLDLDGDGHGGATQGWGCVGVDATAEPTDCDDGDPLVFPGAEERCNDGVDDDCDGWADDQDPEGPTDPRLWFADVDLDGFGEGSETVTACVAPTGNVAAVDGDCNDDDAETYPGAFEGCEPVDRNCDGNLPDATAWWDTNWPVRIPLEVSTPVGRDAAVLSVTLDVGEATGLGFDARSLALVVQDCDGGGAVRLDASFTDGLGGVFEGAELLPLDDGVGGLHAVLDRALPADTPLPLALYALGPIGSEQGSANASPGGLASGRVTASFDLVDGGLLEVSVDALAANGTVLDGRVGSAPPSGSVGPLGLTGALPYGLANSEVIHASGVVAALDVVTPYQPVDPDDASVEQHIRWVTFSDRPEIYGWVTTEVVTDGAVVGLSSLGLGAGALRDEAVATDHSGLFGSWSSPPGHVAFGWGAAPQQGAALVPDDDMLLLVGQDVLLPASPLAAGTLLVDRRLLVVRADGGPVDTSAMTEAVSPSLEVVVASPETL